MSDPTTTFAELGLDPRIVAALTTLGFESPTAIQAEAIPPLQEGRDIVARARTGSGKTAAFGLPMLERLKDGEKGPRALVIAPTRELALQVTEAIESFAVNLNVPVVTVYGGAPYRPQLIALKKGVPIVVGTPGRLIDHLEKGSLDLGGIEMVVLDEADEMLRMGFIDDVETLLAAMPEGRQIALFSATMPAAIRRVANKYLVDPVTVEADVEAGTTTDHVRQRAIVVPQHFKGQALVRYLRGEERGATLVFSRTRAGCGEIAEILAEGGIEAEALHGDLAQNERERVLNRLRTGRIGVVVATDVASRGIDIDHITHVVNMDLPDNPESYTHRIGRTGRAGREGTALTLVTPGARGRAEFFRRSLNATFEDYQLPSDAEIARKERAALVASLEGVGQTVTGWIEHLVAEGQTVEGIAAAALELLAKERGVSLETDLSEELPDWARGRTTPRRDSRDAGPPHRPAPHRGQDARGPSDRPGPPSGPPRSPPAQDEVELFVGAGRALGVRPGDLVGALAGDAGIQGSDIGRIQVGERSSFVGVSKAIASKVLDGRSTLNVRGRDVKLSLAHPGGKSAGPEKPWKHKGPGKPAFDARLGGAKRGPPPGKGGQKTWKGSGGKR
jgi:ATP-dependent RNA helicase DeaD